MYTITNTTDGQHVGKKLDSIENPIFISENLTFNYDKKVDGADFITLSNSNYIINLSKE